MMMKTVEEKNNAIEKICNCSKCVMKKVACELDCRKYMVALRAFNIGAAFAQQWISVEDELPADKTPCVVRTSSGNMCICFVETKIVSNKRELIGWYNYFYRNCSRVSATSPVKAVVVEWRYIELK